MSHTVTVTRTTTTTSTPAILLNVGPFRTIPGLLKLLQIIVGSIAVGLVAYYWRNQSWFSSVVSELFFIIVASTFLITTCLLFISNVVSITTASILPKTVFELLYHFVATVFYLAASINLIIDVQNHKTNKPSYDGFLAACIFGFVNTVLYLCSTYFSHKSYRGG